MQVRNGIVISAAIASLIAMAAAAFASPIHWTPMGEPGSGGAIVSVGIDPRNSDRILIGGDMLGVGRSVDGGKSWQAATGFSCFEDGSFTWHPTEPDTVWVGTMSGPYVSHDGGSTWTCKRDGMPAPAGFGRSAPIEKVLFDPESPGRVLAIGGSSRHWDCGPHPAWGAVWESTDDGQHWHKLTTVTATGSDDRPDAKGVNLWQAEWVPPLRPGQPHGYIYGIADTAGLVVSRDAGKSWEVIQTTGLPAFGRLAITPHEMMWMSVPNVGRKPGGVFRSNNYGHTWTECSTGLAKLDGRGDNLVSRYNAIRVSPTDPAHLYVCDTAWNAGVIYQSTDGGDHWHAVATKNNIGQASSASAPFVVKTAFYAGLAMDGGVFDPHDPGTAYFFNSEFLLATHDDGKTFHDITSDQTAPGQWKGRGYCGICTEHFGFNPYRKGQSIAQGMDAARAWISDDDLHSWRDPLTTPDPWFGGEDCSFAKDGHIVVNCGQYGFHGLDWSTDWGKTWNQSGPSSGLPPIRQGGGRGSEGVYVDPDNSKLIWAVIEGRLYHTTDAEHWHVIRTGSICHFIAADNAHPDVVYVTSDRNLYRVDPDDTVTPLGGPKPGGRIHFANGSLFVASFEGDRGGLWKFDKIKTWVRLRDDKQIMDVAVDPTDPNRLAVATNMMPIADIQRATGVWISADAGKTWSRENDGLAMTRGGAVAFDPFDHTRLVLGTFGRGYFVTHWPADYMPAGAASYVSSPADAVFAKVDETDGKPKPVALRNGDMTAGTAIPTGWDGKWGDVAVARDSDVFASAPASLRVTCAAGKSGQASQSFDVAGGQTITVSGKIKTAGHAKVNFAVQSYNQNWHPIAFTQLAYAQDDSDWKTAEESVELPADAVHAAVVLLVEGDGRAWLDDAAVR